MSESPKIEQIKNKFVVLIEDDVDLNKDLKEVLEKNGLKVQSFQDGTSGLNFLLKNKPDLILCDIKLPGLQGTDVFLKVKEKHPDTPFILMTGFSEIMDIKKAYEIGVTEFLSKPFEEFDIISTITLIFDSENKKNKNEFVDFDFSSVGIGEFVSGSILSTDLYVRLSNKKYLKVAKKGTKISLDRIKNYTKKGIKYLYINKLDFSNYIGLNLTLSKKTQNLNIPKKQKMLLLSQVGTCIIQDLFINEVDKVKFEIAKETIEDFIKVASNNDDIFLILESLKNHSDYLFSHSLGVALYSSMVAKELGWDSKATQSKIILASLLHDIGFRELEKDLLYKERDKMTSEEVKKYETHATRGREILKSVPEIHTDVIQAVLQHHENELGTGFPAMTRKEEIHPLAKVIAVVNHFCHACLKSPFNTKEEIKVALPNLVKIYQNEYDSIYMAAIFKLFNLTIPSDLEKKLQEKKKTG